MNVAVRVATQNAINTSLMAANNAARRARQGSEPVDTAQWAPSLVFIAAAAIITVAVVLTTVGVFVSCFG